MPRPLLLTPDTPPGVSLPGLVSASARLNVLGDVKSTLRSIGLSPANPGCIAANVVGRERELAARLGCPPSVVMAAATPILDADDATILRWGDGAIRRANLETRLRRISPISLATSSHHRAAWCNRLLDHCPESLEMLVDRCSRCGRAQRWLAARGIGYCDERGCGPIAGMGSMLPSELAEGYRLFAALCSPIAAQRRVAMAGLAPELASLPPITLTELTLKVGLALEGTAMSGRRAQTDLSPLERSRAASRGAAALLDWPLRLRREIREELARRGIGDGPARRDLRAGMLAAGRSIRGRNQLLGVMSKALPEIHVEVGRSFAGLDGERLLGSAAALRLGISHVELRNFASTGMFSEEGVVDGSYRRALYDAAQIEQAAAAWRSSAPVEDLMRPTGLPRYACERIVGAGDIERESHPFALTLPGQPRLRRDALDQYLHSLQSACRSGEVPTGCIRLSAAMRIVVGALNRGARFCMPSCGRLSSRGTSPAQDH
jgi:hypothetical protein